MSRQVFKSVEELPLVLNVLQVAVVLGISRNTAYELVHAQGFPKVVVGKQYRIPRSKFIEWLWSNYELGNVAQFIRMFNYKVVFNAEEKRPCLQTWLALLSPFTEGEGVGRNG